MESFDLRVHQVNFEEKDITAEDDLHAFSNLVSCDSDFKSESSYGIPVIGRKPSPRPQSAFLDDTSSPRYSTDRGDEVAMTTQVHLVNCSYTTTTTSGHKQSDTLAREPSEDSFTAFTDTVEALALQKSVIGKSSVKPASQEEILRVIAETQSRIQKDESQSLSETEPSDGNTTQNPPQQELNNVSVTASDGEVTSQSSEGEQQRTIAHTDSVDGGIPSSAQSIESVDIQNINSEVSLTRTDSAILQDASDTASNASAKSFTSLNRSEGQQQAMPLKDEVPSTPHSIIMSSGDGQLTQKELIQIRKHDLELSVEKNTGKSWFSQRSSSVKSSTDSKKKDKKMKSSDSRKPSIESQSSDDRRKHSEDGSAALPSPAASTTEEDRSSKTSEVLVDAGAKDINNDLSNTEHSETTDSENLVNTELSPVKNIPPVQEAVSPSVPNSSIEESDGLSVEELVRIIAKLEGQIEMLQTESSSVLKERAHLQSQVATQLQQMSALENNHTVAQAECGALRSDKDTLRQNQSRLEHVIIDAHKLLQDKDSEIQTLEEDLGLSHEANARLQDQVKSKNSDILSRENTVQDMKSKITELYIDLQMSNQNKLLSESENKSLQSEVKSLALSKEWYQDQLHVAQVSKGKLQKEISTLKSELIGQNTIIERLKADNVRTNQHLADAEQRALSEKEKLAHHLEAIEAQMMEREATFVQLQQQRDRMEQSLQKRQDTDDSDAYHDLSGELQRAQNELRRRQASIGALEHEQADLRKRLTLSQESILERDNNLDSLGKKAIDLEVQLQQAQIDIQDKVNDYAKLRDDKLGVEVELSALTEEKKTITTALNTLKQDMEKVESSFRQMKSDLKTKQDEVNESVSDKHRLELELAEFKQKEHLLLVQGENGTANQVTVTDDHIAVSKSDTEEVILLKESVSTLKTQNGDLTKRLEGVRSESGLLITELKSQNAALKQQIDELKLKIRDAASQEPTVSVQDQEDVKARQEVFDEVDSSIRSWQERIKQNKNGAESLQDIENIPLDEEKLEKLLQSKLISTEIYTTFNQLINVNRYLVTVYNDNRLAAVASKPSVDSEPPISEDNSKALQELAEENDQLKQNISQLKEEISVILASKEKFETELLQQKEQEQLQQQQQTADEQQPDHPLVEENGKLRSKIASLETDSHREIAKQKAKALKLGKDLQATLKSLHEQKNLYKTEVPDLEAKLKATEEQRAKLETEVHEVQQKFSLDLDEKTKQLHASLKVVQTELISASDQKQSLERELHSMTQRLESDIQLLKNRNQQLEAEVKQLDEQLSDQKEQGMNTQQLKLDLERERGRLAGILQSHTALKEHAATLEMSLAERQSSSLGASSQIQERLHAKEREFLQLAELFEDQRQEVEAEKQKSFNMKKELMIEKANHVKVRRQLENLWLEQDQLKSEVSMQQQEVVALTEQLSKAQTSEQQHRADLEHLGSELRTLRAQRDTLQEEVQGQRAKDPVMTEHLQSLEWQIKEKDAEISALKEQLLVAQDRQHMEMAMLRKAVQSTNSEVSALRAELLTVKQEKLNLQTRVAELKGALQASIQHTKLLQKDDNKGDSGQVSFDLSALESLLQDSKSVATVSKPLSFLQATLTSLRGEISTLQGQVDEHTNAVETSSRAWKEVEAQVNDLREVCKSSAADRATSHMVVAEGYNLAQGGTTDGQNNSTAENQQ